MKKLLGISFHFPYVTRFCHFLLQFLLGFPFKNPDVIALQILSNHKNEIQILFLCLAREPKMHSLGRQMLSLALGKVQKKEINTVSNFSNIFGNVGFQNKEVRIYFIVIYLSFLFP